MKRRTILFPLRVGVRRVVVRGAHEDNLPPLLRDRPKRPVGVDNAESIELHGISHSNERDRTSSAMQQCVNVTEEGGYTL